MTSRYQVFIVKWIYYYLLCLEKTFLYNTYTYVNNILDCKHVGVCTFLIDLLSIKLLISNYKIIDFSSVILSLIYFDKFEYVHIYLHCDVLFLIILMIPIALYTLRIKVIENSYILFLSIQYTLYCDVQLFVYYL